MEKERNEIKDMRQFVSHKKLVRCSIFEIFNKYIYTTVLSFPSLFLQILLKKICQPTVNMTNG